MRYHRFLVALANMGRLEESYPLSRTIFRQDKNWRILLT